MACYLPEKFLSYCVAFKEKQCLGVKQKHSDVMRSSQAWRSASWHFALTRKVVLWWDWRTLCFSPRFLSANWEAWAVCSLCSFTPDICDRVMGPELFFRARKALLKLAWSSPGDKSEEGLGQREMWQRKHWCCHLGSCGCPHVVPTFPGLNEATKPHILPPPRPHAPYFTAQNVFHARKIKRSYWKAF